MGEDDLTGPRQRIYLSATSTTLAELWQQGELGLGTAAHAVTHWLREWYLEADEEELEYVAFTRAAQDSLPLLDGDPTAQRRRVVIAADLVGAAPAQPELGSSLVRLDGCLRLADVAAVHVDGDRAMGEVAVAAAAVHLAGLGDDDAVLAVDATQDHELEWYDVSEVPALLAGWHTGSSS